MLWVPYLSPISQAQVKGLRGRSLREYEVFRDDLAARGCGALGYRLTGQPPISGMCCKHLYANDRAIVTFAEPDEAWILLIAPHDERSAMNVYQMLYMLAGVDVPTEVRTKPSCCDELGAVPPLLDAQVIDELVHRLKGVTLPQGGAGARTTARSTRSAR